MGTKAKLGLFSGSAFGLVLCPGAGWLLMRSLRLGIKDMSEKTCMKSANAT